MRVPIHLGANLAETVFVIPAEAGIQLLRSGPLLPAFAGTSFAGVTLAISAFPQQILIRACCVEFKFSIYNAIHMTYSIASEKEL